jgi:hypothetical protein
MAFGDFTVVRSTVKRVLNSSGVLASVAVNTPAFEFNADGSYKGLLVEPAGTNLMLRSEELNNASWSVVFNASVSANATTAPDGTTTADKIVESATNAQHYIGQTPTSTSGTVHTISIFAKASERTFLFLFEDSAGGRNAYFNLSNGTVGTVGGSASANIIDVGSGWYRCSVTYTSSGTLVRFRVATASANGTNSYLGDGTSGIFVWGAQAELGAVATSYIPTVASTVTRGADDISLSSASSLIGATEGTMYCEVDVTRLSTGVLRLFAVVSSPNPGTTTSEFYIYVDASNNLIGEFISAGVPQASISFGALVAGVQKFAFAYKANDFAFYRNGTVVGTDTSGTNLQGFDRVRIGSSVSDTFYANAHLRSFALFPTRLSNATLATLTTL